MSNHNEARGDARHMAASSDVDRRAAEIFAAMHRAIERRPVTFSDAAVAAAARDAAAYESANNPRRALRGRED
jgi:hypothetical protein